MKIQELFNRTMEWKNKGYTKRRKAVKLSDFRIFLYVWAHKVNFRLCLCVGLLLAAASCSVPRSIGRAAAKEVLAAEALRNAHVGISIYEPATGKWWYNYQGDKYFVPASNTKIPTCYAAMKYLGDSLVGLEYTLDDSVLVFKGSGDPTLLHPGFTQQPALDFLARAKTVAIQEANFSANRWGAGWAISDITASYAPERSELPVYGNVLKIVKKGDSLHTTPSSLGSFTPANPSTRDKRKIAFERPSLNDNVFQTIQTSRDFVSQEIPFVTGHYMAGWILLMDTLRKEILHADKPLTPTGGWRKLYSRPTDSLLRPLMHRSDNLFAEQALLMVSNRVLGYMNDAKIIDTLLKTDFAGLPQPPRWADGSGLSRYNLFTPQSLVTILHRLKTEFGAARIRHVFAAGGEGTLSGYYTAEQPYFWGKTGTLSGVVALSGYLTTEDGRELIVSVLVNNHRGNAPQVRRVVEKFLQGIRNRY